MAGTYSLRISFSGIVGAQTPIELMVQSAATDLTRTYGYGTVLQSKAGVTSSLFVQTRDGYGNNALVDPEQYPLGLEEISFELCKSIKDDPTKACSGGEQEQSISVTLAYGTGPPGYTDTAYGLYTVSYFPFSDGMFMPLVWHNSTVVACLFDTSGLPVPVDPGPTEADACILQNQIETASTGRRSMAQILSMPFQQSGRRLAAVGKVVMVVNATFKEPNLDNAKHWSFLAPLLAAVVGVFFDLCCGFIIPSLTARHKDIKNQESPMVENEYTEDKNTLTDSFEDKGVAECPVSSSFCTRDSVKASNYDQKSVGKLLDSTTIQSQDHAGGMSYKGNQSLPNDTASQVSASFSSGENAGLLNDAGKGSCVSLSKANSNSNLVFLKDSERLQGDVREETGIRQLPVPWQRLIPDDEPVWSLAHHPATGGSGLDPWVSHVSQGLQ
jgi:hypothetical protein